MAAAAWGWLPLLTGLAVLDAVHVTGVDARLKWPNDILVGDRKLAGILAERVGGPTGDDPGGEGVDRGAVVVGIGINVSLTPAELPVPTATSLLIEGAVRLDRDPLLRALLRALGRRYLSWRAAGGNVGAIRDGGTGPGRATYAPARRSDVRSGWPFPGAPWRRDGPVTSTRTAGWCSTPRGPTGASPRSWSRRATCCTSADWSRSAPSRRQQA